MTPSSFFYSSSAGSDTSFVLSERRGSKNRPQQRMTSTKCARSCLDPVERFRQSGLRVRNRLLINLISETVATFILLFIGSSTIVQFVLAGGKLNNFFQVSFAWAILIALLVFATSQTSGGHMNPAVSLAFWSIGKLPLAHLPLYILAQTTGAFFGTALCYQFYSDAMDKFDGGVRQLGGPTGTGHIFCSFPEPHISNWTAFLDQLLGTAVLLLFICALIDPRNRVPAHLHPLFFGLTIFLVCSSLNMNVGSPINPARDFGPRLFLLIAYGSEAFTWHGYYFWIPIFAPLIGGLFGTWLYQLSIGIHIPDEEHSASVKGKSAAEDSGGEEGDPLNAVVH